MWLTVPDVVVHMQNIFCLLYCFLCYPQQSSHCIFCRLLCITYCLYNTSPLKLCKSKSCQIEVKERVLHLYSFQSNIMYYDTGLLSLVGESPNYIQPNLVWAKSHSISAVPVCLIPEEIQANSLLAPIPWCIIIFPTPCVDTGSGDCKVGTLFDQSCLLIGVASSDQNCSTCDDL